MKTTGEPILIEQDFPCNVRDLWSALTEPEQMQQWFFDNIPDFRPKPGFQTAFMVDTGERQFLHQWRVTNAQYPNLLVYSWRYKDYAGAASARFELSGDDRSAQLRFEFVIEQDFDDSIPEFTRAAGVAGWRYFICESLSSYLGRSTWRSAASRNSDSNSI